MLIDGTRVPRGRFPGPGRAQRFWNRVAPKRAPSGGDGASPLGRCANTCAVRGPWGRRVPRHTPRFLEYSPPAAPRPESFMPFLRPTEVPSRSPHPRTALWGSPVRPGREHDTTCARAHGLVDALNRLAVTLSIPTRRLPRPAPARTRPHDLDGVHRTSQAVPRRTQ